MDINAINGVFGVNGTSGSIPAGGSNGSSATSPTQDFTKAFGDAISKVNDLQGQANTAIQQLVTGESQGLHEVMIAMEKANISFQFLTQVRNKALESYHEIMRMQV